MMFFGLSSFDNVYIFDHLPAENMKARARHFYTASGGPALNASITYAILNGATHLLTPLGNTTHSDFIRAECSRFNVFSIDVAADHLFHPTVASIAITGGGVCRTIWSFVESPMINIDGAAASLASDAPFLHLDGYFVPHAIQLAHIARDHGRPVILDAGSWKPDTEQLLPFCDIVIASDLFASPANLSGRAIFSLFRSLNIPRAAVTRGADSVIAYDEFGEFEISPPGVTAVDTLGAGDVFHGAFDWAFTQRRYDFRRSIDLSCQIASRSCQYLGPRLGVQRYLDEELQKL